jgi:hypothetical protein
MDRLDTTHAENVGSAKEEQHSNYTSSIHSQRTKLKDWLSSETLATLDHTDRKAPEFSVMLFKVER